MERVEIGDKVLITEDLGQINSYMYKYAGMEATVTGFEHNDGNRQICKLDVDGGHWCWDTGYKCDQITKI
jgi:hypothetical protein